MKLMTQKTVEQIAVGARSEGYAEGFQQGKNFAEKAICDRLVQLLQTEKDYKQLKCALKYCLNKGFLTNDETP